MALIIMAVWDTVENRRVNLTDQTLYSLATTVQWSDHRMIVVDNGSCSDTVRLLDNTRKVLPKMGVITLPENIGQARALNIALAERRPGELIVKMDNDIVIEQQNWIEDMELVIRKDPTIAIIALKKATAWEHPSHPDELWRSSLEMLPHEKDEPWMVIEVCNSIVGTCEAIRPEFLDQIGYFYQMGNLWGFIDPILGYKAHALGYRLAFLPHVRVNYLGDDEDLGYRRLKESQITEERWQRLYQERESIMGGKNIYRGPEED